MPSPSSVPSASSSNGVIRSRRDSAPSWQKMLSTGTGIQTCAPPATTRSHEPSRRCVIACWTAINDDAQAASTVYVGPIRSSRLAIRPTMMFGTSPGTVSGLSAGSTRCISERSRSSCSGVFSGYRRATICSVCSTIRPRWTAIALPPLR